jgi:hypothetical protein
MGYRFHNWARVRPVDLRPDDAIALRVVAVVGYGGEWAAYMGLSDWTDEDVVHQGDKILREAAEGLFPQFVRAGLVYRD